MESVEEKSVVRLSMRWVLLAFIVIFAIGALGGIFSSRFIQPRPPLTTERDQIVTTVQEVAISPSQSAQQLVQRAERSTILLVRGTSESYTPIGVGSVITNDGLVVSVHPPASGEVFGIDTEGKRIELSTVGSDALYGTTYYRVQDAVLAPFDLAQESPTVGMQAAALWRSSETARPVMQPVSVVELVLPEAGDPQGLQQLAQLDHLVPFSGTPLLDDAGALAGISLADTDLAITITEIRASLDRITSGKREVNPYEALGFTPQFVFRPGDEEVVTQFEVVIDQVDAGSRAADYIRAGDIITAINSQEITWQTSVTELLEASREPLLTIRRGDIERTVTLSEVTPSPIP